MSKRLVSISALLLMLLLCSIVSAPSAAADYSKIGVKVGDRADYSVQYPDSDRLRIEVSEVTGTFVNLTVTYQWSNGTVVHLIYYGGNVSSGDVAEALVCGGLQAGDPLWQGGFLFFDSTVNMEIAGATRTVNEYITGGDHYYFDQATGILAKVVAPGGSNYTMISTNLWSPGMVDPVAVAIVVGIAAIAIVAIVAAVKLKKAG